MIDHATQARLTAVRTRFAKQMPAHVAQLRADWDALCLGAGEHGDVNAMKHFEQSVHRLIESSATFAYDELGIAASRLNVALRDFGGDPGRRGEIDVLIAALWP